MHARIARLDAASVVTARFAVGLRIAFPLEIGAAGGMTQLRFALLNALGAVVW